MLKTLQITDVTKNLAWFGTGFPHFVRSILLMALDGVFGILGGPNILGPEEDVVAMLLQWYVVKSTALKIHAKKRITCLGFETEKLLWLYIIKLRHS